MSWRARAAVVIDRVQGRDRLSDALPVLIGLHDELGYAGALDRCDGGDLGALIEQHQLFELDVADLASLSPNSGSAAASAISQ